MIWNIKDKLKASTPEDRLTEVRELLLKNLGLQLAATQQIFFNPPYPTIENLLPLLRDLNQDELTKAVTRIKEAIKNQQPILIYGDYDCDGVCSTAILWQTLHSLGAIVYPFIPHRQHHGYGLTEKGLTAALEYINLKAPNTKPLIITVDNGITAIDSVKILTENNIDLIITDHHTKPAVLPNVSAIVHTTTLSGSGVAWLLASTLTSPPPLALGLAALGTVCDLLPLLGPNRQIVTHGLKALRYPNNPGLEALYHSAGITDPSIIDTYHLGYVIGPRINAVGRLDHALDALRLLCTSNPRTAASLAEKLNSLNLDRQEVTAKHSLDAINHFSSLKPLPNLLFISSPDYHEGIIGLIASRLVEQFNRPAIVISTSLGLAKASARSVHPINITKLISHAKDHLLGYGGHHSAAGFSLNPDNLDSVKNLLELKARDYDPSLFDRSLDIELELEPQDLTFDLLHLIEEFAPFGVGNQKPIFSSVIPIASHRLLGQKQNHLKINPASPYQSLDLIGFNLADKAKLLKQVNRFAFTLDKNIYNGRTSLQLILKDLAEAV